MIYNNKLQNSLNIISYEESQMNLRILGCLTVILEQAFTF